MGSVPADRANSARNQNQAVEYINCISVTPNTCSGYDTKQSDGEALVMLDLLGMRNTSLLSSPQVSSCPEW